MLIYNQLGQKAVDAMGSSFGVSYAMGQITEWKDIATEVVKGVFILMILERLLLSSPLGWLEGPSCWLGFHLSSRVSSLCLCRSHRLPQRERSHDEGEGVVGADHECVCVFALVFARVFALRS
jgi:hypothetical protein